MGFFPNFELVGGIVLTRQKVLELATNIEGFGIFDNSIRNRINSS
jgi:hypothetical protein